MRSRLATPIATRPTTGSGCCACSADRHVLTHEAGLSSVRALVDSDSERLEADRWLAANGVGEADTIIGIHPGASLPEKRWPVEKFAEVARDLARRPATRVIAFSDPEGYGATLASCDGVISRTTTLRELVALIARCDVLVCNDSGPMHLAGGLGTPTVAVFASGVARWFAPVGNGHEIVTGGDDARTGDGIDGVSPDRVLAAVDRLLSPMRPSDKSRPSWPQLSPT